MTSVIYLGLVEEKSVKLSPSFFMKTFFWSYASANKQCHLEIEEKQALYRGNTQESEENQEKQENQENTSKNQEKSIIW